MKHYRSICRFCSNNNKPNFVPFKEYDGIIECENCGAKHRLVPVKDKPKETHLELIDRGRNK